MRHASYSLHRRVTHRHHCVFLFIIITTTCLSPLQLAAHLWASLSYPPFAPHVATPPSPRQRLPPPPPPSPPTVPGPLLVVVDIARGGEGVESDVFVSQAEGQGLGVMMLSVVSAAAAAAGSAKHSVEFTRVMEGEGGRWLVEQAKATVKLQVM